MEILNHIGGILWGPYTSLTALGISVVLVLRCRAFYLLHPIKTVKLITGQKKSGAFKNMLTALGGSIGVGNISGVALAIKLGGAGAVFWMWVCALFTMILKYSEIILAVKYRDADRHGGAMLYLKKCAGGSFLSAVFCISCIFSSFGIGCMVQSNSCALSAQSAGMPPAVTGAILAALCAVTVFGGGARLKNVSSVLVPAMSVFYIAGTITVIAVNCKALPTVIADIFNGAFSQSAAVGGIGGTVFAAALRQGMSKGIFSSEAGMGSSAIMYSHESGTSAMKLGILGMLEVFIDTIVMCSLTAFAILSCKADIFATDAPYEAFCSVFGVGSSYFLAISLFFFAFTSISCWNFYGKSCVLSMTKSKAAMLLYNAAVVICIYVGANVRLEAVWSFSDICNFIMLAVNMYGVIYLFGDVKTTLPLYRKASE